LNELLDEGLIDVGELDPGYRRFARFDHVGVKAGQTRADGRAIAAARVSPLQRPDEPVAVPALKVFVILLFVPESPGTGPKVGPHQSLPKTVA